MGMLLDEWEGKDDLNYNEYRKKLRELRKQYFPAEFVAEEMREFKKGKSTIEKVRELIKEKGLGEPFVGDILPPPDPITEELKHKLAEMDANDAILVATTDGDDYDQLDKVDPNIKILAVNGDLPGVKHIKVLSEDILAEAAGPSPYDLTGENKNWILLMLGFRPYSGLLWEHPALNEPVMFSLSQDDMFMIINRVFKKGIKKGQDEISKTAGTDRSGY